MIKEKDMMIKEKDWTSSGIGHSPDPYLLCCKVMSLLFYCDVYTRKAGRKKSYKVNLEVKINESILM